MGTLPHMGSRSVTRLRARLWRLAEALIDFRFDGPDQVWAWQLDLLNLQRDIQAEISALKARGATKAEKNMPQALRLLSRHLGDAFAWILLAGDRQTILALHNNSPVPISPVETETDVGMLAMVEQLMMGGWGFGLLHDVTTWLRVGDVTFISTKQSDRHPRTVELKTSVTDRNEDGTTAYQVTVVEPWDSSLGDRSDPKWQPNFDQASSDDNPSSASDSSQNPAPKRRPDRRLQRQSERMSDALARVLAKEGITELPDKSRLVSVRASLGESRWREVKAMIAKARQVGYAHVVFDSAVMYVAVYDRSGLDEGAFDTGELLDGVNSSGIAEGECLGPPSLVVRSLPPVGSSGVSVSLPFYLLSAPKSWIKDMIYGRLALTSIHNPGRYAAMAAGNGDYSLRHEPASNGPGDFLLDVPAQVDGQSLTISIPGIGRYITEMVEAFRGVEDFIAHLPPMAQAAKEHLPAAWAEGAATEADLAP